MTCKDCVHFDICDAADSVEYDDMKANCPHFTNKADFVEVVRCSQCKYWNNGDCYRLELSLPDDFCSYGERSDT